jgi:hypothetical protein
VDRGWGSSPVPRVDGASGPKGGMDRLPRIRVHHGVEPSARMPQRCVILGTPRSLLLEPLEGLSVRLQPSNAQDPLSGCGVADCDRVGRDRDVTRDERDWAADEVGG